MLPRSVKIEKLKMKKSIERDLGPSLLAARGWVKMWKCENTSIEPLYLYRTQKLIPNSVWCHAASQCEDWKIENEEIYRTRSRAQSVGGAGLSENVKMWKYLYRTSIPL